MVGLFFFLEQRQINVAVIRDAGKARGPIALFKLRRVSQLQGNNSEPALHTFFVLCFSFSFSFFFLTASYMQ